ncbi:class I SAM-dependent methyltransferase [Pelagibacteraceae bacterium]|jgi:hypothetical protein|nr:class I SAM-dependent methyltransferase [Pelagibacteraceae bacterium]
MAHTENIKYLENCKICGSTDLTKVLTLDEQFLSPTFVKTNKNNALAKIKSPLTLVLCDKTKNSKNCGLLQLKEITETDLLYKEYFYRSAINDTMRKDLKDLVNQAIKIAEPNVNDTIVDIGSNDCTLLNFYNQSYNLVGYEPAQNINYIDEGNNINIINNYFNFKDFNPKFKKAKIITSCAMFYDLESPKDFVKDISKILDDEGIWCCQISYVASMLKYNNFYDICHEHLSYYSISTFEHLINQFDLKCFYAETNGVNGGSIRLYVCKKKTKKYDNKDFITKLDLLKEEEEKFKLSDPQTFFNFDKKVSELKDKTVKFVNNILNENKKILGLGASTKGNVVLQHFGFTKEKIPFISERNPEKVGLKCLGSDIELISEKKAREINPEAFIVLPWNFKEEVVKREKEYLENGGKLMFVMPYPHIISKEGERKL